MAALLHDDFDLVLLDVMLPGAGGLDVLRTLRTAEQGRRTPVLLMSPLPPHASQADFGWTGFLRKPFSVDELLAAVARHVGSDSGQEAG
ncbi:MAG: response regulator [Myxococcales bacterium]